MAEILKCPNCGRKLRAPEDSADESVQCPFCEHTFEVSSGGISAEPIPSKSGSGQASKRRPSRYDDDDDDDADLDNIKVHKPDGPMPHNYIVESVLVLLCCCQLFGIIALVHGVQVSGHFQRGDYKKALEASETAKKWCIWGALLGPIATVLVIGLQIMLEMQR
jgi:hypothetical protein